MYTLGQKALLALNQKIVGRIFFKKMQCQKSPSFLLHQVLFLFSTINLVYVLEINIFPRDGIIQIWIISSKDINYLRQLNPIHKKGPKSFFFNIQCFCKLYYGELGQYLSQFDALEKSVTRLQITTFKNCNKWTPVYKDYWR